MPVISRLISYAKRFRDEESGATAIEYGLFAALISAVIVATVSLLGEDIHQGFIDVRATLNPPT